MLEWRRGRLGLLKPWRALAESRRHLLQRVVYVQPEATQVGNGRDGQGQVPRIDGATDRKTEAVDSRFGTPHLFEQATRNDERAGDRGVALDDRGAPAKGGFHLIGEQQGQRSV